MAAVVAGAVDGNQRVHVDAQLVHVRRVGQRAPLQDDVVAEDDVVEFALQHPALLPTAGPLVEHPHGHVLGDAVPALADLDAVVPAVIVVPGPEVAVAASHLRLVLLAVVVVAEDAVDDLVARRVQPLHDVAVQPLHPDDVAGVRGVRLPAVRVKVHVLPGNMVKADDVAPALVLPDAALDPRPAPDQGLPEALAVVVLEVAGVERVLQKRSQKLRHRAVRLLPPDDLEVRLPVQLDRAHHVHRRLDGVDHRRLLPAALDLQLLLRCPLLAVVVREALLVVAAPRALVALGLRQPAVKSVVRYSLGHVPSYNWGRRGHAQYPTGSSSSGPEGASASDAPEARPSSCTGP